MNEEDADQESFCSDSDDAGTSDSNTVALRQVSITLAILVTAQEACCVHRLEMADINTRNIILTVAGNRGLSLWCDCTAGTHICARTSRPRLKLPPTTFHLTFLNFGD